MEYVKEQISKLGYEISFSNDIYLIFEFNGYLISSYPYSGWHTGKSIKDGRDIDKLLKQLKP